MNKSKFNLCAVALGLIAALIAIATLILTQPVREVAPAEAAIAKIPSPDRPAFRGEEAAQNKSAAPDNPAFSLQEARHKASSVAGSAALSATARTKMDTPPQIVHSGKDRPPSALKEGEQHTAAQAPVAAVLPNSSARRTPAQILAGKDLSDPTQRASAVAEMTASEDARYAGVLAKAKQLGVPARLEGPEGGLAIIHDFRGDKPLYRTTLNANAAISTGANLIRQTAPYNLNGSGIKVGIWDGGSVRNTHQEFSTNRVVKRNSTTANDDHATHVAGTIGATGVRASAKGMAPLVAIDSYDWKSDYAEMTAAGAATSADPATKIPISNHSYGYDATTADMGRYETECNTTDALAAGLPYYLVFWAAGNEQDLLTALGGYQSITFNGLAKNIMTIGAADDAVSSGLRDVNMGALAYFSSMGPCDDGRIKPDLVANGVDVYSCVATSTNAYDGTYSGTSMATPNAAGSAVLLQQLYKTNFSGQLMRASMLKALLVHTATDMGRPGPDYQYGWGYMNVKAAADIILSHKANAAAPKMIESSINATNKVRSHTFEWDGLSSVRATLVWTDPAGAAQTAADSRARNLVNDLDLKITAPDGTTSYLPYVMPFVGIWTAASMTNNAVTGTNRVDNVERVDIPAPVQAGIYTVTVGMYGTNALTGTNQVYSLVVTGGNGSPPTPTPTPTPSPSPSPTPTPSPSPSPTPPANNGFFAASDVPLAIPDDNATGVTSTINVSSSGQISALSVSVNIKHTYKGDLRVTLISPAGTSVVLHNQTGSDNDNVVLVDVPVTVFNNTTAAGQWKLQVQDLLAGDTGTLNSWSLAVTTGPTPTPTPPANTGTFAASDVPAAIPDNSTTGLTSLINVNVPGRISSLTVSVNIKHTYKGDLRVTLVSPAGTSVVLHNRTGSSNDNVVLVNVPLTTFNSSIAAGQWRLRVQDLARYDTGTLSSWSLTVRTVP